MAKGYNTHQMRIGRESNWEGTQRQGDWMREKLEASSNWKRETRASTQSHKTSIELDLSMSQCKTACFETLGQNTLLSGTPFTITNLCFELNYMLLIMLCCLKPQTHTSFQYKSLRLTHKTVTHQVHVIGQHVSSQLPHICANRTHTHTTKAT